MAVRQAYDVARRTYNESINASRTVEVSPVDQQVLWQKLLNAVTTTGASTQVYVLDKKDLVFVVTASSTSTGGTFTFEGSADGTNWGAIGTVDKAGSTSATQDIAADGTVFFQVINCDSLKYVRANLSSVTDGTYTVYLIGGAL